MEKPGFKWSLSESILCKRCAKQCLKPAALTMNTKLFETWESLVSSADEPGRDGVHQVFLTVGGLYEKLNIN